MHCICVQLLAYIFVSGQTLLKKEEKNEKRENAHKKSEHIFVSFSIHVSLIVSEMNNVWWDIFLYLLLKTQLLVLFSL